MPFPVGLVFVGNNEFAMQETASGFSVLSGAVRSRLTFEVPLSYEDLSDTDMTLILQSRGVNDPAALSEFVSYFSQRRIKRDLRQVEKAIARCQRLADGGAITGQIARDILRPIYASEQARQLLTIIFEHRDVTASDALRTLVVACLDYLEDGEDTINEIFPLIGVRDDDDESADCSA